MTQDRAQLLITAVDQTRSAFDSIRGNLAKLGNESNRVKGLLAGLGVSLSVAGFAAMIKNAIDAADQLNKLSQKIGISVEALSTLRFAAQLSDVSLETLQKGIKGLSQNIAEANTGIGDGAQVFDALGISVKNADGSMKSTEAVLLQMADVFANLEDGAVKTALAVKLFGKSGMDMIPFLNQGAAGINQLTAEAERLGLKLTTETARSAEALQRQPHGAQGFKLIAWHRFGPRLPAGTDEYHQRHARGGQRGRNAEGVVGRSGWRRQSDLQRHRDQARP